MKRIVLLFICILLLVGCATDALSTEDTEEKNQTIVFSKGGEYGFSIIYNKEYIDENFEDYMIDKAREYMQATGYTVELIGIKGLNLYEYNTKLNSKLILENGPTLLLENMYNYGYWMDKPFVDPRSIENYKNIYEPLQSDKFIPLTAFIPTMTVNIKALDSLGVNYKELDAKKYYKVKKEFLVGKKRAMDHMEFNELFKVLIDDVEFVDENGFLSLTNDSIVSFIETMKTEILSDTYELPSFSSDEEIEQYFLYPSRSVRTTAAKQRTKKENYLMPESNIRNGLDLRTICEYNKDPTTIYTANFLKRCDMWFNGILINPNGVNKDIAIDFVDGLLSTTSQGEVLNMWGGFYGTVVKDMDEIKSKFYERKSITVESTRVVEDTYKKLASGYYDVFYNEIFLDIDFKRIILDYVFTDKYEDLDMIKQELKKIEDKYNFYH